MIAKSFLLLVCILSVLYSVVLSAAVAPVKANNLVPSTRSSEHEANTLRSSLDLKEERSLARKSMAEPKSMQQRQASTRKQVENIQKDVKSFGRASTVTSRTIRGRGYGYGWPFGYYGGVGYRNCFIFGTGCYLNGGRLFGFGF